MKKLCNLLVVSSVFASMGAFADVKSYRLSDSTQFKMGMQRDIFTEAWEDFGNPANLDGTRNYKYSLSSLPKNGALKTAPWSDTYWPSYQGGIDFRWQDSNAPKHPTLSDLKANPEWIDTLSPAEKFDVYMGDFSYTLSNAERSRTAGVTATWEGLCHAWAPVAYLFKEPGTAKMKSKDGLTVNFFSSDVKALLIYAQHSAEGLDNCNAGIRCNDDNRVRSERAFRDINPGSFHVILTNQVGIQKKGFVFDRTSTSQVWNQPVFEYHVLSMQEVARENLPASALSFPIAEGAVKFYQVQTQVIYGQEVAPSRDKNTEVVSDEKIYDYILDVNDRGQIVGGSWLGNSISDHPDFVWTSEAVSSKTINPAFKSILTIYNKASGGISSLGKKENKKESRNNRIEGDEE